MDSLRFDDCFKIKDGDSGDLFQRFVYQLLRKSDYFKLHRFPTAGKDGGIDLIQQLNKKRTVIECKYIGSQDIDVARSRWQKVRRILEDNITGVSPKEKQFSPWYRTDKPITSYIFCVSSEIRNQQGFDELEIDITAFFRSLANDHPHLKHLEKVSVEIIDWSALRGKLDNFSQLKFAWFPLPDKIGFIPIDRKSKVGSFRAFLDEESLPFYKRSEHLKENPNSQILAEEQLLEKLESGPVTGLIISGNGGVGKTRLTFELGRLAQEKGWIVFRAKEILMGEAINELAKTVGDKDKILLLFDYIETQNNFIEIVENLHLANEFNFNIKYIANCRTSYYSAVKLIPDHLQIALTKTVATPEKDVIWIEKYQNSVVHYILNQGSIVITDEHLDICKGRPILAVFILYLYKNNRSEDLNNLLHERNFGSWIIKRIRMSFSKVESKILDFDSEFTEFIAMFPFPKETRSKLGAVHRLLLDILANDGWVETDERDYWRNIHDVFADQILLSYLEDKSALADEFITDAFSLACSIGCLESAFLSYQRLAPYLKSVNWGTLIKSEADKNIVKWVEIRNLLLETPLLEPTQKIQLLQPNNLLWENSELDIGFQDGVASLIRTIVKEKNPDLIDNPIPNLKFWLDRIITNGHPKIFILSWGIRFAPNVVKDFVLDRIHTQALIGETGFLLTAWLSTGLSKSDIEDAARHWLKKYGKNRFASFFYQSWLNSGGDKDFVQVYIKLWLDHYQLHPEAQFIYKSWLDAGGDEDFVQAQIKLWLDVHQTTPEASHIYKSWLDAGGDKDFVQAYIKLWLDVHQTTSEARFVYKSWLDAGGDKDFVQTYIKLWLDDHQSALEASHVYPSWLDAGGDKDFVQAYIKLWLDHYQFHPEAQFVYKSWLDAGGDKDFVQTYIKLWLDDHQSALEASHVYPSWLDAGGDKDFVQAQIKLWLDHYQLHLEARFVYKSWLDAGGDKDFVKVYIKLWLDDHQPALEASHVYKSWLNAAGDKDFVQAYIKLWLDVHQTTPEASHVYKSWLDAGGDKDFVQVYIKLWLDHYQLHPEAQFVYKSWLDAGGDKDFVRAYIKLWLDVHQTTPEASHVYKSWLDAGGDKDFVQAQIKLWLDVHQTIPDASHVYPSWLDAGGDKDFVQAYIKLWLDVHQTTSEARFVYKSWLDAGGDKDFVQAQINLWLDDHQSALEASHVYPSWLDAGGDKDFVQAQIKLWLDHYQLHPEAQFVYKSWLDAGGDKDFVQAQIKLWLDDHQTTPEASHIYKSWLDAGGDKDFVQDHIKGWLEVRAKEKEADFVMRAWLNAGGDTNIVQDPIRQWLETSGEAKDADFVMRAWLEAGEKFDVIKEFAIRWLAKNYHEHDAVFLTKNLSKQNNLPQDTVKHILYWCFDFYDDEDALWRLTAIKFHLLTPHVFQEYISAAERIIQFWRSTYRLPSLKVRSQINEIFYSLFNYRGSPEGHTIDCVNSLFGNWLRHPHSFGPDLRENSFIQRPLFLTRFTYLLEEEFLDISRDHDVIGRFLSWLENWRPINKRQIKPRLEDLGIKYPSGLWDIVTFEEGSFSQPAE